MRYTIFMIIDGKIIAQEILTNVQKGIARLDFQPVFCDLLVGGDPASAQYVRMKAKTAEKVGMKFRHANFPASITTERLVAEIKKINQEPNLCGLIVQLPLPASLDKQAILDAIEPRLDVDCTGRVNMELFYSGRAYVEFPTAAAVMEVLKNSGLDFTQKKFLVIGYGQLVGKPVSFLLEQKGYKFDIARSKTENILELMKNADVIISAVGKAKLVTGEKIEPGCVVVDAGTSESDGGIVGDVDFASVKSVAGFVSPVPGGVGPITVACLLANVLKVAQTKI